jgi:hypothetical protein
VIGVQQQEHVEGARHDRVDLVGLGGIPEGHPQEVLGQAQRVVRVEERLPHRLLVGVRRDRGQLGQEPDRRVLHLLGVERVEAVLVERRQGGDRGRQDRHGVSITREALEERLEVFVEQRVVPDLGVEGGQLARRRQLPVDEQVARLEV